MQRSKPGEAREHRRASYMTPLRIEFADGRTVDGQCQDISEGGLFVVTKAECSLNKPVKVRLPLPVGGKVVVIEATTRWSDERLDGRGIGLELRNPPKDVKDSIRKYVELMAAHER